MATGSDLDDLINGGSAPPKVYKKNAVEESSHLDLSDTYRGVTITWLMNAYRMDRATVKKRLADCPPLKYAANNVPVYDFVQACDYLAKPKMNMTEYLNTLKPEDLPTHLQKEFWDAKLKRQKYEVQAADLWHTADVIEVFGEAFKHIKTSMQLWQSHLDRTTGLSSEQYKLLETLTDTLLDDLHKRLVGMKDAKKTLNALGKDEVEGG